MQTIVTSILIFIAGLIAALLICATTLISRVRAVNTTLRRIEETLLSINRVKAINTSIKSPTPVTPSPAVDAGGVGFLTVRELKAMSGGGRPSADSAPMANVRKPPRTRAPRRSTSDLQAAIRREGTLAVPAAADVATNRVMPAAAKEPDELDSRFEISWPRSNQQTPNMDLRDGTDKANAREDQVAATSIAHELPAANGELPVENDSGAVTEAPVAINPPIQESSPEDSSSPGDKLRGLDETPSQESTVVRAAPAVDLAGQAAPTSNSLDEIRRKRKEQELLMIISSRRRRARAGR